MKRLILHTTLCLCAALSALSCSKDEAITGPPAQDGEPCAVTFRIETENAAGIAPAEGTATRAADNAVRNLNFYVYGNRGLVRSGYTASAFVPTMTLAPGSYRVYAVANAGSSFGQISETELLALATPATSQDGFLQNGAMYLAGMQTLTVAGPTSCRIALRRAAAKIHMRVQFGAAMAGGRIVHVIPGNAPATCSVFGENRLTASDPQLEFPYSDISHLNRSEYDLTYYQYENLAGSVASITAPADRTDGKAPEMASYVSIRVLHENSYCDYKVYLGGNATTDFNVRRNTVYNYDVTIEGVNADDLRVSKTEIVFWAGNNVTIGGKRHQDGFHWSTRVAYAELNIETVNCDPDDEYVLSFRKLAGTFHRNWEMQYMVLSVPSGMREYLPLAEGQELSVRKGNGRTEIMFAFSNYEGTQNHNTTDNYFEFTVRNKKGWGRTVVLSTNMDEWYKP